MTSRRSTCGSTGAGRSTAALSGRRCGGVWPEGGSDVAATVPMLFCISPVEGASGASARVGGKRKEADGGWSGDHPPPPLGLSEQAEQGRRGLVGDGERLDAQLLLR